MISKAEQLAKILALIEKIEARNDDTRYAKQLMYLYNRLLIVSDEPFRDFSMRPEFYRMKFLSEFLNKGVSKTSPRFDVVQESNYGKI